LFEDLRSAIASAGWVLPDADYFVVRGLAALGVLAACAWARRRVREPLASFLICAAAAWYLMLFNPRNNGSSYVIIVGYVGLLMARAAIERRRVPALTLGLVALAFCSNYHVLSFGHHWLKPLACIGFGVALWAEARKHSSSLALA
jgi:hypothetical protein